MPWKAQTNQVNRSGRQAAPACDTLHRGGFGRVLSFPCLPAWHTSCIQEPPHLLCAAGFQGQSPTGLQQPDSEGGDGIVLHPWSLDMNLLFFPFHLSFERPSCTDSWLCPFFPLTIWQREALYGLGYCVSFLFHDTLCIWSLSCISFYLLIKFIGFRSL